MTAPAPRKFLFDVSFDQPRPPVAMVPAVSFSEIELEAARAAGFADGRTAGLAEATMRTEEHAATTLAALASRAAALIEARQSARVEAQSQAIAVLRAILQKLLPELCRKDPLAEIEALVTQCLGEAFDEPRLVLRVADALFEAVQAQLATLTAATGFAGKLVLLADPALGVGDCRIEWADGGLTRDCRALAAAVDARLAHALATDWPCPSEELNDE